MAEINDRAVKAFYNDYVGQKMSYEQFIEKMRDTNYASTFLNSIKDKEYTPYGINPDFNQWYSNLGFNVPQPPTAGQVQSQVTEPQNDGGIATVTEQQLKQGGVNPPTMIPPNWNPPSPQQPATPSYPPEMLEGETPTTDLEKKYYEGIKQGKQPWEIDPVAFPRPRYIENTGDYLMSQLDNTAIGLAYKAVTGEDITHYDKENSTYQPEWWEQGLGGAVAIIPDLFLFPVGGAANSIVGSVAKGILQQGVKREVLAETAKYLLKPGVQSAIATVTGSAASLGTYDAMKNVLTQIADPDKDIDDINRGEVWRTFGEGNALGGLVGILGFSTKIANQAIKAKLGTSTVSKATQGAVSTTGFALENAGFVYGGAFLQGQPLSNVGWKDLGASAVTLGALKLPHMFNKSKNFDETKVNKDEFKTEFNDTELNDLDVTSTEEAIEKHKDREQLRKTFSDEKIPQITKAKLAWALEGVYPTGNFDITSVETKGNTLIAKNKAGELVYKESYASEEDAQNQAVNFAAIVSDRQRRRDAAMIPVEDRIGIMNDFKGGGGNAELLQSALDKSFEPWNRTPEEIKEIDRFDNGVKKFWEQRNKEIEKLKDENETIKEQLKDKEKVPSKEKKKRLESRLNENEDLLIKLVGQKEGQVEEPKTPETVKPVGEGEGQAEGQKEQLIPSKPIEQEVKAEEIPDDVEIIDVPKEPTPKQDVVISENKSPEGVSIEEKTSQPEVETTPKEELQPEPKQSETPPEQQKADSKQNTVSRRKQIKEVFSDEPQDIEEAILQYFAAGNKIDEQDFLDATGIKKGSTEHKAALNFPFKKYPLVESNGRKLDVLYEIIPILEKLNESGARDISNAVGDILNRYPTRAKMLERLLEIKAERNNKDNFEEYIPEDWVAPIEEEIATDIEPKIPDALAIILKDSGKDINSIESIQELRDLLEANKSDFNDIFPYNKSEYDDSVKFIDDYERRLETDKEGFIEKVSEAFDTERLQGEKGQLERELDTKIAETNRKIEQVKSQRQKKLDSINKENELALDISRSDELDFGEGKSVTSEEVKKILSPYDNEIASLLRDAENLEKQRSSAIRDDNAQTTIFDKKQTQLTPERKQVLKNRIADNFDKISGIKKLTGDNPLKNEDKLKIVFDIIKDATELGLIKAGEGVDAAIKYLKEKLPSLKPEWIDDIKEDIQNKFYQQPPKEPVKETPKTESSAAEPKVRGGFTSVKNSEMFSQETLEGLERRGAKYYTPKHNIESIEEARHIISVKGLDESAAMVHDNLNGMHPATRQMMREEIAVQYKDLMVANKEKNLKAATEYYDKMMNMLEVDVKNRTSTAQALQAMTKIITPETEVFSTAEEVIRQRNKKIKDNVNTIDGKSKILRDENEKGADKTLKSPKVKKGIEDAVNNTLKEEPTQKPTSKYKEKSKKEREYRDSLLKNFKKEDLFLATSGGLSPKAIELVANLAASYARDGAYRTADIAIRISEKFKKKFGVDIPADEIEKHIPKEVDGKTWDEMEQSSYAESLAARIIKRMETPKKKKFDPIKEMINTLFKKVDEGLPKQKIKGISAIDKIAEAIREVDTYRDVWEESKEIVKEKIENLHIDDAEKDFMLEELKGYFNEIIGNPASRGQIRTAVKEGLKSLDIKISDVIRQHYTVEDATRRTLTEKLIEDAGLKDKQAELLAKLVDGEFRRLTTEAKLKALKKALMSFKGIVERAKKSPKTLKTEHDKLIELSNLGAFSDNEFRKIWAESLGIKDLTPEQITTLESLAKAVQDAPEGRPKAEAIQRLMIYKSRLPGIDWGEIGTAIWYGNLLSGLTTQQKNIGGNTFNYIQESIVSSIKDPSVIPLLIKSTKGGYERGLLEGYQVFKTGYTSVRGNKMSDIPSPLEQWSFKGGKFNPTNYAKFVMRFMYASDAVSYEAAKNLRAYELAKKIANKNGIKAFSLRDKKFGAYKEVWAEVDKILNNTEQAYEAAKQQAETEGLTGAKKKLRIYELMEMQRNKEILQDTHDFAAHLTYNHPTEGLLGVITDFIANTANNKVVIKMPFTDNFHLKPLKAIVPFTRIIANVANTTIDYSPYGFVRAAKGGVGLRWRAMGNKFREYTPEQRTKEIIKASVGLLAMTGLYILSQDDKNFEITANGYGDWAKNNDMLIPKGWKPYTIRIGDKRISYQYTPLLLPLSIIGFLRDREKYQPDKMDEDWWTKFGMAVSSVSHTILDMTAIQGMSGLLETINSKDPAEKLVNKFIPSVKSIYEPAFYTQSLKRVEEAFNIPEKDAFKWYAKFLKTVPIARNSLYDKVNIFGEPIYQHTDVFLSDIPEQPEFEFLVKNNLVISKPDRRSEGLNLFSPEDKAYIPMTDKEYFEFATKRGKYIKEGVQSLMQKADEIRQQSINFVNDNSEGLSKEGHQKVVDAYYHNRLNKIKESIVSESTARAKAELFGNRIGLSEFGKEIQQIYIDNTTDQEVLNEIINQYK